MGFIVEGAVIGSFALMAAPANYRVTGVENFTISYEGVVCQKDVGPVVSRVFRTFVEAKAWWCSAPPRGSRKFFRARSCRFARFRWVVHFQISPHAPVRAGDVPQSSRGQHQRRFSIRKCPHCPRSSSHFPQRPLQRVVRSQTPPVLPREHVVIQHLFNPGHYARRSIRQLHQLSWSLVVGASVWVRRKSISVRPWHYY